MHVRKKYGMTLVETVFASLVSLVIAGIALPAMQDAREEVGRVQCARQLSTISQAMLQYQELNEFLPPLTTGPGPKPTFAQYINELSRSGGYPKTWAKYEIELMGFGNATGRIAFHYFNGFMNVNGNYVGIDTFRHIPLLLGDVNCDGFVNLLDIDPFLNTILSRVFNEKADLNSDGVVDLLDVEPLVDAIVGGRSLLQ